LITKLKAANASETRPAWLVASLPVGGQTEGYNGRTTMMKRSTAVLLARRRVRRSNSVLGVRQPQSVDL